MRWERPPLVRPDSTEVIELCKTDLAKSIKRCADVRKAISQTKVHIAESKELFPHRNRDAPGIAEALKRQAVAVSVFSI